jgi:hypothetical protein
MAGMGGAPCGRKRRGPDAKWTKLTHGGARPAPTPRSGPLPLLRRAFAPSLQKTAWHAARRQTRAPRSAGPGFALGRASSPFAWTASAPCLERRREGTKARRRKRGSASRCGGIRARGSDRWRREERSARPATGTRGWTTFAAFVLFESVQTSVKSRGVPVLPAFREGGGFSAFRPHGPGGTGCTPVRANRRGDMFSDRLFDRRELIRSRMYFAPTVGFPACAARPFPPNRAMASGATRPRSCSTYVPACQAPISRRRQPTRFRPDSDHGMPRKCGRGGTGRRRRLKISCPSGRAGSSPAVRTINKTPDLFTARFRPHCRYRDRSTSSPARQFRHSPET